MIFTWKVLSNEDIEVTLLGEGTHTYGEYSALIQEVYPKHRYKIEVVRKLDFHDMIVRTKYFSGLLEEAKTEAERMATLL